MPEAESEKTEEAPSEDEPAEKPEEEKEPAPEEAPAEEKEDTPAPEQTPAEEPEPVWTPRAELTADAARGFIGSSLYSLTNTYGMPDTSYYEYSCSGPGDDGILTFGSVTVYTYREPDGSAETVVDAE